MPGTEKPPEDFVNYVKAALDTFECTDEDKLIETIWFLATDSLSVYEYWKKQISETPV